MLANGDFAPVFVGRNVASHQANALYSNGMMLRVTVDPRKATDTYELYTSKEQLIFRKELVKVGPLWGLESSSRPAL